MPWFVSAVANPKFLVLSSESEQEMDVRTGGMEAELLSDETAESIGESPIDDATLGILSSTFSGNPVAIEDFFGLASASLIVSSWFAKLAQLSD